MKSLHGRCIQRWKQRFKSVCVPKVSSYFRKRDLKGFCRESGVITYNIKGKHQVFDPCNNPADAMRIVIENKIAMNPKDDIWQCGSGWTVAENKNPLRACMEAFLMKKDAENES